MADRTPPSSDPGWGVVSTKSVAWHDPMATARAGLTMSGVDYLSAIVVGRLPDPPIATLMSFRITSVSVGRVEMHCSLDESFYNPLGTVHGGLLCTLLDSASGCAVHSALPAGAGYTSIDLSVSFMRSVTVASGALTARGWVTKVGRRVAFADAEVVTSNGKTVASAKASCLLL